MKSPIQAQPTSPQECPVILLINATPFLLSHRGIWSKMVENFRGMDMITVIYRVTLMCVAQRRGKTFQCVWLASLLNETGCALSEHPIFPPAKTQAQGLAQLFVLGFECLRRVNKAISACLLYLRTELFYLTFQFKQFPWCKRTRFDLNTLNAPQLQTQILWVMRAVCSEW